MYLHFALGRLYESDLDMLVEELGALHNKWRALGEALGLSDEKLEVIGTQHSHTEDCLQAILIKTLPTPWHDVIHALREVGGPSNMLNRYTKKSNFI